MTLFEGEVRGWLVSGGGGGGGGVCVCVCVCGGGGFKALPILTLQWRHNEHNGVFKSPESRLFTQPFVEAPIKENIKAPRQWSLWGKYSVLAIAATESSRMLMLLQAYSITTYISLPIHICDALMMLDKLW